MSPCLVRLMKSLMVCGRFNRGRTVFMIHLDGCTVVTGNCRLLLGFLPSLISMCRSYEKRKKGTTNSLPLENATLMLLLQIISIDKVLQAQLYYIFTKC